MMFTCVYAIIIPHTSCPKKEEDNDDDDDVRFSFLLFLNSVKQNISHVRIKIVNVHFIIFYIIMRMNEYHIQKIEENDPKQHQFFLFFSHIYLYKTRIYNV